MPPELNDDAPATAASPDQWQTLDQWLDTPQFREMMRDEFPDDAAEWLDPVSRRKFLTLMGASMALAGAVGCNRSLKPASRRVAIPYVEQPVDVLPGVPLFFATAYTMAGGVGAGVLVKQSMGRPLKVEGNPNHPGSLGATDSFAQASVLGLYDPDRSKATTHIGVPHQLRQAPGDDPHRVRQAAGQEGGRRSRPERADDLAERDRPDGVAAGQVAGGQVGPVGRGRAGQPVRGHVRGVR